MHTLSTISLSAKELKRTRVLVRCAMLLAMQVVLGMVGSITITENLRISFGYLCTALAGMLYGPVPAMFVASAGDLLLYVLKPSGTYFFGLTLSAALGGLVYGMLLYNRRVRLKDILIVKLIIGVFINIGLNTLWLSMLYNQAFMVILPMRVLKNFLQYFVDVGLLLPLLLWVQARREKFTQ
jgi:ECF transporter S component (folate family)